jgi:hypothetical protein
MEGYLIKGGSRGRSFDVLDPRGEVIAQLRFPSIWSTKAEATVHGANLLIAPVNMWGRRFSVTMDGRSIGTVDSGGFRSPTMQVELNGRLWDLRFKRRGFFRWSYELSTNEGIPLLNLRHRTRWLTTDYAAELPGTGVPLSELPLLLCLSAFLATILRKRAAAAAAAT